MATKSEDARDLASLHGAWDDGFSPPTPYATSTYKQLAVNGAVLVYAASVAFEEIRDTRVTSEDLRDADL